MSVWPFPALRLHKAKGRLVKDSDGDLSILPAWIAKVLVSRMNKYTPEVFYA